ncbi:Endonuclease/exonuclease/phosphatase [Ochromonadaceae sp. CCMP2298]|nr:Endonuclease/exonuclease/phosphatase [Ochromonadaceae sp. CCMP2298]
MQASVAGEQLEKLEAAYQRWVYNQLETRVQEYSDVDEMVIKCATWNVNAKFPQEASDEYLREWLWPEGTSTADIYVITLQEVVDLNVLNSLVERNHAAPVQWMRLLLQTLNAFGSYAICFKKTLVGLMVAVFVRTNLVPCIHHISCALTYAGNYGTTGNKGGISVSLRVNDSSLCFVAAHFHAHRENVAARNADFHLIRENADFVPWTMLQAQAEGLLCTMDEMDCALSELDDRRSNSQKRENERERNGNSGKDTGAGEGEEGEGSDDGTLSTSPHTFPLPTPPPPASPSTFGFHLPHLVHGHGGKIAPFSSPAPTVSTFTSACDAQGVPTLERTGSGISAESGESGKSEDGVAPIPMSPVKRRDSASSSLLRSMFESETARPLSPTRHTPKSTQGQGQGASHAVRLLLGYSPEVVPLLSHEYVFWMGDLNYRIDHISTDEVLRRIKENRLDTLIISDQLYIERQKQNCFTGFREGPLSFNPTYKYEPGTDEYEKREGKPLRAPAWCDRILWKCQHSEGDVTLMHYRAAPALRISDHKPVSALFSCRIRRVARALLLPLYTQLLATVDQWMLDATPRLAVQGGSIDFGAVTNNIKYSAFVTLANTGKVMADWSFVPREQDQGEQAGARRKSAPRVPVISASKSWLSMSPPDGVLAPGAEVRVEVVLELNLEEAYDVVNRRDNSLEDVLVLRVQGGADYFCAVSGVVDAATCEVVCNAYAKLHINRQVVREVKGRGDDEEVDRAKRSQDSSDSADSSGSSSHRVSLLRSSLYAGKCAYKSVYAVTSAYDDNGQLVEEGGRAGMGVINMGLGLMGTDEGAGEGEEVEDAGHDTHDFL